jgi:hypothetical protein
MDVIQQQLVVKEWPLKKPGDEQFFGYVVALGAYPSNWEEGMYSFADFAYGDSYTRYRLPPDEGLRKQLLAYLEGSMALVGESCGLYAKVWVTLTDQGYKVDLP